MLPSLRGDHLLSLPTEDAGLVEDEHQCAMSVLQQCGASCKHPFEIIQLDIRETV